MLKALSDITFGSKSEELEPLGTEVLLDWTVNWLLICYFTNPSLYESITLRIHHFTNQGLYESITWRIYYFANPSLDDSITLRIHHFTNQGLYDREGPKVSIGHL